MSSSVFDMIGPIMIGPSSSHTAGVVRIGNMARAVLGQVLGPVKITFYNSFATTYKGHGSDKAILGGLLGLATDDARIKEAEALAKEQGLAYQFSQVGNASQYHPNTIEVSAQTVQGHFSLIGESLGGGVINLASVNGFKAGISGNLPTLWMEAEDKPGVIAFVSDVLAHDGCNIASMAVSRRQRNGLANHFVEVDTAPKPLTLEYLRSLSWLHRVQVLGAVV